MDMQKMKSGLTILAITGLVSILPLAAAAQDQNATETDSPFIQQFDQNGDGIVSEDEFPGNVEQFERMDSNADGHLDATETPTKSFHGIPRAKDMLTGVDADGDGQISASEFPGPSEHFDNMDKDGDGYLSAEELKSGRPGPSHRGSRFESDDVDQDGKVSVDEFSGPAEYFETLDINGDGYITKEENESQFHGKRPPSFSDVKNNRE